MHYAYGARRTVRGALRLDDVTAAQVIGRNYTAPVKKGAKYRVNSDVTAAQVIGRNYTAPVKKGAKYRVNSVYEDYSIRSTIRATTSLPVLPFCGGEYTVTVSEP